MLTDLASGLAADHNVTVLLAIYEDWPVLKICELKANFDET